MSIEIWGQDDNGNRFLEGSYPDRQAEEGRIVSFQAGLP